MGYSGAGEKLIDEKNQKQKISWHCPFKYFNHKQRFYALGKWTGMFIPDPGYGSFPSRNPDSDLDYR